MSRTFTGAALITLFEIMNREEKNLFASFNVVVESDEVKEPIKYQCTGVTIDKETKEIKIRY